MNARKKKLLIIGSVVLGIIVVFVLLTTVGKPLFSKSITAEKLDDFRNVCYGNKIINASDYSSKESALIAAFYERPFGNGNPWTNFSGAGAPNMTKFGEVTKTNVVACFEHQPFAGKEIARCEDGIKLLSATYKTTFYEAKTGKKIAEGKEIVTDNSTCPSIFVYGKNSRETARDPATEDMKNAIIDFID